MEGRDGSPTDHEPDGAPPDAGVHRYATPTGGPCPRTVHVDGTVEGTGECLCCGFCLLVAEAAWGVDPA